jgi:hypothetical protein
MKILQQTALFIIILASISYGQKRDDNRRIFSEGFYINVGVARGPDFADFFNYTNGFYQSRFSNTSEKLDRFDKGVDFGLGYIVRLYPNFALDVGFSIYRLKSAGRINNNNVNPSAPELYIDHDLEYQVGLFSATVPVLLDFDPRQPLVPYAGIGISIFSMRLDDIRDDGLSAEIFRETNTSVGGHFETGLFIKATRRIWIDFKARWHSGSTSLRALEPAPPAPVASFKVRQDIAQITLGGIYYFR